MAKYLTINCAAKEFGIPNNALRSMQKRGELPGFYSGSRFYINCEMFADRLDSVCRSSMGERCANGQA